MFLLLSINGLQGQTAPTADMEFQAAEFNFPPLQVVIDSVLKRSAMVGFQSNNVKAKEAALASEKLRWSDNLGLQVDSRYGNLNNFSSNEDGEALSQVLTTTKQFNYSVGVYVKFPLFAGINRRNQIEQAQYEMEAAKKMIEFEHEQIKQAVIALYQDLLLKQRLLHIKSKTLGDGTVNMQMVEKEFRNGIVPISEYVRIKGITASMEEEYEVAMSQFITAKQRLETLAGFAFEITN
ncbi:TolC family protein [Maribacter sp. 2307ULW6-5]|uniref:TolC family protein n=1 Tax=Maribacter sp. 2307ULW6-5 TaxID=3386275 RepID=UPI0039BC4C77